MRRLELDSLRGIAALIVLTYHALALNILVFLQGSQFEDIDEPWGRILAYTPLRFFWSGGEAVWIFFVLSGFVLSTAASAKSFRWGSYFPSRLVRLYVPVAFAILLTFLSIRLFPHIVTDINRDFLGNAAVVYSKSSVINDLLVITGPTNTLGPLWSLRWEILFSLLLPVYLFMSSHKRHLCLVICVIGVLVGFWLNNEFLMFMPMFYLGTWLATFDFQEISSSLYKIFKRTYTFFWAQVVSLLIAITLISSYWVWGKQYSLNPILTIPAPVFFAFLKLSGIVLLMVTILVSARIKAFLSKKSLVFLGTISFSLYLVHWPVVVTSAFLLGPGWVSFTVGFVLSLLISILFYYLIEARAHKLSRRVASSIIKNESKYTSFPL